MEFVVILKTVKDLKKRPKNLKHVPDWFPLETTNVLEAESIDHVVALFPRSTVVTLAEWKQIEADKDKFDTKPKPKKWYEVFS